MDKFRIFNKIKINTDKYEEVETNNNEKLKLKMEERLNLSQRSNKKRKIKNRLIGSVAVIGIIVIGIGVTNPSLADNFKKRLPEFESMLDKIKESMDGAGVVEYDPQLYPELEEEKKEHKKSKLIATPINVSSKDDGLKITIDKAMYDKKKIYLDMILKTDEPFNKSKYKKAVGDSPYGDGIKEMYISDLEMYMNDVKLDSYGYSTGIVDFIDENTINLSYLIEFDLENPMDDVDFKMNFGITEYKNPDFENTIGGKYSFDFNIKSIDDNKKSIIVDKKDGDYILKKINVTDTYVEVEMELPFQESLGNPHNNFIILHDDKGRELKMSSGVGGDNKMYTQINELIDIGERPKYIDVFVCTNYGQEANALSNFRVNIE
ncbi:MAG: DUF4179 domain-containing protein [Terrisporobacter sp.]